jgi:serine/threonine protein kinase
MAPEQIEGQEADARTDIFAFGCVLYEMLAGKKAFDAKTQAGLISAIMTAEPPSLATTVPQAPPTLNRVLKVCLEKEADDRWQTARSAAGTEVGKRTHARGNGWACHNACTLTKTRNVGGGNWISHRRECSSPVVGTVAPGRPACVRAPRTYARCRRIHRHAWCLSGGLAGWVTPHVRRTQPRRNPTTLRPASRRAARVWLRRAKPMETSVSLSPDAPPISSRKSRTRTAPSLERAEGRRTKITCLLFGSSLQPSCWHY